MVSKNALWAHVLELLRGIHGFGLRVFLGFFKFQNPAILKCQGQFMTASLATPNDGFACTQGCLLGQLAGNSLGSLMEFNSPQKIRRIYPNGFGSLKTEEHAVPL